MGRASIHRRAAFFLIGHPVLRPLNIFPATVNPGNCPISMHVNATGAMIVP
jgi:hypothetical protein